MLKFLKKNGYYIMLAVCLICIGTMIAIAVTSSQTIAELKKNPPTTSPSPTVKPTPTPSPSTPVDADAIKFSMPVEGATVGMSFSDETFVFSETLNQWQTHTGIDFLTTEPTDVFSVADGTIESVVTDDILNGGTVVVDHGNGIKSVYKSLATEIPVKVGDKVTAKSVLGKTSMSAYSEFKEGAHLHFELSVDGTLVDPTEQLGMSK